MVVQVGLRFCCLQTLEDRFSCLKAHLGKMSASVYTVHSYSNKPRLYRPMVKLSDLLVDKSLHGLGTDRRVGAQWLIG